MRVVFNRTHIHIIAWYRYVRVRSHSVGKLKEEKSTIHYADGSGVDMTYTPPNLPL